MMDLQQAVAGWLKRHGIEYSIPAQEHVFYDPCTGEPADRSMYILRSNVIKCNTAKKLKYCL